MSEVKDQDNLFDPEKPLLNEALKRHPLLWTSRHHKAVKGTIPASFKGYGERVPEIGTLTKEELQGAIRDYTNPDFKGLKYLKDSNASYFIKWLSHVGQFEQVLRYLKKDKRRLFSPEEIKSIQDDWKNVREQISSFDWIDGEQ
jgi:hypothetical protein